MGGHDRTLDKQLAAIAGDQAGNVTRQQALAAGVSSRSIEARLRSGSLIRVHDGVYRVGHAAPSRRADCMAAVLACGERAGLSGRAAAHLMWLVRGELPPIEVSASRERNIEGVVVHRWRNFHASDLTSFYGIPVTTPARTLVDLARSSPPYELARAFHEAAIRFGTTAEDVELILDRMRTAKGAGKLRVALRGDVKMTASKLERIFLRLLRRAGLPLPEVNKRASGRLVDCRWPEHRLTVELDGYRYHATRHAWEADRKREREAYRRGDQFRRYTWDDVTLTPDVVLAELRPLLGRKSPE